MRGDVYRVTITDAHGREQRGTRYVIIVQNEDMHLSTCLAVPTSTSDGPAKTLFRPSVVVAGRETRALAEFVRPINPDRLGTPAGRLTAAEMARLDEALRLILDV